MRRSFRDEVNVSAMVTSIALAVGLFYLGRHFLVIQQVLRSTGYAGTFIVGILYVYSFTSLSATALLAIISKTQNFWLAGTIATVGAVVGDVVLFRLFRSAQRFDDDPPHQQQYARWWTALETRIPASWHSFVIGMLVFIFLVLPLPNEFADFLLARIRKVTTRTMLVISYVGNGIGLYAIVWLARWG